MKIVSLSLYQKCDVTHSIFYETEVMFKNCMARENGLNLLKKATLRDIKPHRYLYV